MVPDRVLAEAIQTIGPYAARGHGLPIASDDNDRDATWLAAAQHDDAALRGVAAALARHPGVTIDIPGYSPPRR